MLGVDIDSHMIKAAISNLHKLVNDVESKKHISANMTESAAAGEDQGM